MIAIPSSYKDPAGFLFIHENEIYRAINQNYQPQYNFLQESGLYEQLVQKKLLIPHSETNDPGPQAEIAKIIKPVQLPLISYASEWSFTMLKDAAICTLDNALHAVEYGMILKDANTFNIQFYEGKPILIDTLSFEFYNEEESWIAYRQFCEHFVAPLVLMKYVNLSLNKLLIAYPNGIPLHICRAMLPRKARWNMHVYLHIILPAKMASRSPTGGSGKQVFSKQKMLHLLRGLKDFLQGLQATDKTTWDNYYQETILSNDYLNEKKSVVDQFLQQIPFQTMLDLGANEGEFSLLAAGKGKRVIAVDEDRHCIEKLYRYCKNHTIENLYPLIIDLTAPTPAIGWANTERSAFFERVQPEVTLALALIHHLAIAHNIALPKIVDLLHSLSEYVIIEFVEKGDPKVQQLLLTRQDIFAEYSVEQFKNRVVEKFEIMATHRFKQTTRTLFLLKRKSA